jgi:hypothetical protein
VREVVIVSPFKDFNAWVAKAVREICDPFVIQDYQQALRLLLFVRFTDIIVWLPERDIADFLSRAGGLGGKMRLVAFTWSASETSIRPNVRLVRLPTSSREILAALVSPSVLPEHRCNSEWSARGRGADHVRGLWLGDTCPEVTLGRVSAADE